MGAMQPAVAGDMESSSNDREATMGSRRRRTALVAIALTLVLGGSLYVYGGWTVAKAGATRIALGRPVSDYVETTTDYYDELQRPSESTYVRVQTPIEDNFIHHGLTMQVNFIVTNLADDRIPPVPFSVAVKFGPTGWHVDGYGSGG